MERQGIGPWACGFMVALLSLGGCTTTTESVSIPNGGDQAHPSEAADNRPLKPTAKMKTDFGHVAISQGKLGIAEEQFRGALKLDRKYAPAYQGLAKLYLMVNEPDRALGTIDEGLLVAPDDAALWNERAVAYMRKKDSAKAVEAAERAVRLAPGQKLHLENLASMLAVHGQVDRAFDTYCGFLPPAEARYRIAGICHSKGDKSLSVEQLRLACHADPRHERAQKMLRQVESGSPEILPAGHTTPNGQKIDRSVRPAAIKENDSSPSP